MASTQVPAPVGEISSLNTQIDNGLSVLRGKLQSLDERLSPILRTDGPAAMTSATSSMAQRTSATAHGAKLTEFLTAIDMIGEHAQTILNRIEL